VTVTEHEPEDSAQDGDERETAAPDEAHAMLSPSTGPENPDKVAVHIELDPALATLDGLHATAAVVFAKEIIF
jgi:hypothetical protein